MYKYKYNVNMDNHSSTLSWRCGGPFNNRDQSWVVKLQVRYV